MIHNLSVDQSIKPMDESMDVPWMIYGLSLDNPWISHGSRRRLIGFSYEVTGICGKLCDLRKCNDRMDVGLRTKTSETSTSAITASETKPTEDHEEAKIHQMLLHCVNCDSWCCWFWLLSMPQSHPKDQTKKLHLIFSRLHVTRRHVFGT